MNMLSLYVNLIRVALVILIAMHVLKRDNKKIAPAAVALGLTFVPWLLGLMDLHLNVPTAVLFPAIVCMAVYAGSGWKYYDRFIWWDRLIHGLSGVMFVSFGITLAEKTAGASLVWKLLFGFCLSLAAHVIWEVLEYAVDCAAHTDHQRWQKAYPDRNHQPEQAIQPPGLVDTMNDMIACVIGAVVACAGWWIALA